MHTNTHTRQAFFIANETTGRVESRRQEERERSRKRREWMANKGRRKKWNDRKKRVRKRLVHKERKRGKVIIFQGLGLEAAGVDILDCCQRSNKRMGVSEKEKRKCVGERERCKERGYGGTLPGLAAGGDAM